MKLLAENYFNGRSFVQSRQCAEHEDAHFECHCRPHIMTVNCIHPLFAANVVAVFTWHIGTLAGIFAMKVIWVDDKNGGCEWSVWPSSVSSAMCQGRRCLFCVNISFLHPHTATKIHRVYVVEWWQTGFHVVLLTHFWFSSTRFLFNKQPDSLIIQICSVIKLYMFRAFSLPIIRSFPLYIRHW